MSALLFFKQTSPHFFEDDTKLPAPDLVDAAIYNDDYKSYNTEFGRELIFLIWKTDNYFLKIMIGGHLPLESKGDEARYVSPDVVKYISQLVTGSQDDEIKLKNIFLANIDELNDKFHTDFDEDDFDDTFLFQYRAIAGFYIEAAKNGNGVIVSMPS